MDRRSRQDWTWEEEAEHQRQLQEQRAAWEQRRKQEREQQRIAQQRGDLESYLQRRARAWTETTGSTPPHSVMEDWQRQFMDAREAEAQAEKQAQLAATIRENYPH